MDYLFNLFENDFMPHGHCYFWQPEILWPHVLGDLATGIAYFLIPILLIRFIRKRSDVEFSFIFQAFAAFILFCGATHILAVVSVWDPVYRFEGVMKVSTAIISLSTVLLLIRKMPQIESIPSHGQLAAANNELMQVVHERVKAEEDVRMLNKTLEDRVKHRTKALEQANKELESFSSMVSHDLHTPLKMLNKVLDILLETDGQNMSNEGHEAVQMMRGSIESMSDLIDGLLQFSRMRDRELSPEPVDMHALVESILEDLTGAETSRKFETHLENLPTLDGDLILLKQVMSNLLGNAVKYTAKEDLAVIKVSSWEDEVNWGFKIADNGTGFSSEGSEKLFELFHRQHTDTEFKGSGVGLAIVQRIVQRKGGRIWAESSPGQGATFFFTLAKPK